MLSPDLQIYFPGFNHSSTLLEKTLRRITKRSLKDDANKPFFNLERNFRKQLNPDFSNLQGKRKLVRKIGVFENSGLKLQCSIEKRKGVLVPVIGRFEKLKVPEIEFPLQYIIRNIYF